MRGCGGGSVLICVLALWQAGQEGGLEQGTPQQLAFVFLLLSVGGGDMPFPGPKSTEYCVRPVLRFIRWLDMTSNVNQWGLVSHA
jgi:hypothetical protein